MIVWISGGGSRNALVETLVVVSPQTQRTLSHAKRTDTFFLSGPLNTTAAHIYKPHGGYSSTLIPKFVLCRPLGAFCANQIADSRELHLLRSRVQTESVPQRCPLLNSVKWPLLAAGPLVSLSMMSSGRSESYDDNQASGKSSLTVQFVDGHFVESYYPTIENTFSKVIRHRGQDYATEVVDTAGQVSLPAGSFPKWPAAAIDCLTYQRHRSRMNTLSSAPNILSVSMATC